MAQDVATQLFGRSAPGPGAAAPTAPKPTAFDRYSAQGQVYNAPTFAQYDLDNAGKQRSIYAGQIGLGLDQTGLQNNYLSDSRDLALQQGQNGLDLAAAQRQPQLLAQLLGLDNKEFDLQRGDAGLAYRKNLTSINSDATARGAFGASGTNDQRAYNYTDLAQQMGHIGVAQDKNTANATETQQQAQERIANLNMVADRYGMKGGELQSMLDNQLKKLGLDNYITSRDLVDGVTKNDLAAKQLMNQIYSQAGQYALAGRKK